MTDEAEKKDSPPRPPALTEEEFAALVHALSRAPGEYLVHFDGESYVVRDQVYVNELHDLRSRILGGGCMRRLGPRPLGVLFLELAASLLARSMSRETFERNARLWYDSVRLDEPAATGAHFTANARGGKS